MYLDSNTRIKIGNPGIVLAFRVGVRGGGREGVFSLSLYVCFLVIVIWFTAVSWKCSSEAVEGLLPSVIQNGPLYMYSVCILFNVGYGICCMLAEVDFTHFRSLCPLSSYPTSCYDSLCVCVCVCVCQHVYTRSWEKGL